jgi:hypothetical protein
MSLTLTNIPKIMRSQSWMMGAALMEDWFSRPLAIEPHYGTPNTGTITMSWALGYRRAKAVYDKLMKDRIWANPAAQKEVDKMLRGKNLVGPGLQYFGLESRPTPSLDSDYINFRAIGGGDYYGTYYGGYYGYYYDSDLDDLVAALGYFVFRLIVGGTVQPSSTTGGHEVTITDVGVYIRDSYDFNGDQHLGFWDDSDNSVSTLNFLSGTRVTNEDFRDWRTKSGRGGDFLVFSDVLWTNLTTPDKFVI